MQYIWHFTNNRLESTLLTHQMGVNDHSKWFASISWPMNPSAEHTRSVDPCAHRDGPGTVIFDTTVDRRWVSSQRSRWLAPGPGQWPDGPPWERLSLSWPEQADLITYWPSLESGSTHTAAHTPSSSSSGESTLSFLTVAACSHPVVCVFSPAWLGFNWKIRLSVGFQ